jgi:hypothetical protein
MTRGIYEEEDFQTVLRAAGKTEGTQEHIQDWLELDDKGKNCCNNIFLFIFIGTSHFIKFSIYSCSMSFIF